MTCRHHECYGIRFSAKALPDNAAPAACVIVHVEFRFAGQDVGIAVVNVTAMDVPAVLGAYYCSEVAAMNWGGVATAIVCVGFVVLFLVAAVRNDRLKFQAPVRTSRQAPTLLDNRDQSVQPDEPFE